MFTLISRHYFALSDCIRLVAIPHLASTAHPTVYLFPAAASYKSTPGPTFRLYVSATCTQLHFTLFPNLNALLPQNSVPTLLFCMIRQWQRIYRHEEGRLPKKRGLSAQLLFSVKNQHTISRGRNSIQIKPPHKSAETYSCSAHCVEQDPLSA